MQDTLDITGAGYEYDFRWLYAGYSILVRLKDTTHAENSGVTDGGSRLRTSPWQDKCKNWVPILFIFRYSVLFWFSVSCCFFAFLGSFWTAIFRWFRVWVYRNPHPYTLSFLKFFLNVGEGPPTVASGRFSATFPGLAKISSYATGLQIIYPE